MAKQTGIMFIINSLFPGGAEHVLYNLVQSLVEDGKYQPHVVCLKQPGPLSDDFESLGVPVYSRLLKDKYDARAIYRLARLIREHRIKVVVPVGSGGDRMFWGTLAARLSGARVVVWSHTFSQPDHPEFELPNRVLYPLVDRFVALGRRHKSTMAWHDKVPEGKISVIPNGVRVERFVYSHWRDRARSVLGLADENITAVGMIGNMRPSKRHDLFIQAAKQVVSRFRDVHFFIIGDGPNRRAVRNWAEKSELLGKYLSLLGHRQDVPHLLPGLDMICVCSEFQECQSLVALQAMASGVPVVSNDIGSMNEAIIDNQTGFFYPALTSEALADKILEVVGNPQIRKSVSDASQRMVRQKFTSERLGDDFTHLFDQLLTRSRRNTGEMAILSRIPFLPRK